LDQKLPEKSAPDTKKNPGRYLKKKSYERKFKELKEVLAENCQKHTPIDKYTDRWR